MLARSLPIQGPCHRQQVRLAARRTAHRVPRLAATPPQAPDGLIDVETLRNLSPEARKVFQEAQANIMEINRGRIRALEELKLAKKRISELEGQLQEALQDVNQAAAQVAELKTVTESFATLDMPFVQEQPATAAAPDAAASAAGAPPFHAAAPAQAQAPPGQPQAPQEPSGVLIVYETSWNTAFLHFNADNKGWTNCPGNRMEEGRDQYSGKKVLKVPCARLEFVANNGKDDWDHPDQFDSGGTKNYVVTTPGVYHLKGGKISKMA